MLVMRLRSEATRCTRKSRIFCTDLVRSLSSSGRERGGEQIECREKTPGVRGTGYRVRGTGYRVRGTKYGGEDTIGVRRSAARGGRGGCGWGEKGRESLPSGLKRWT